MAEQFLTLMADFDDDSQAIMSAWYNSLNHAGFMGTQTPNLPFHISMATFPLEKEREAVEITSERLMTEVTSFVGAQFPSPGTGWTRTRYSL